MLSFATGCKEKVIEPSEADVTIAFFDAIYNQKSLQKTLALSSNSFKKEIEKYITIRNFSHRALSLHFDSVTINTQHAHTTVIDEFNIQVDMTVLITGIRDGKTYKEVKNIRLVKNNKTWLVDQLLED
jgi:hypothetical protein